MPTPCPLCDTGHIETLADAARGHCWTYYLAQRGDWAPAPMLELDT